MRLSDFKQIDVSSLMSISSICNKILILMIVRVIFMRNLMIATLHADHADEVVNLMINCQQQNSLLT